MRVVVLVKATEDSENGVLPTTEMFEAMGKLPAAACLAPTWATGTNRISGSPSRAQLFQSAKAHLHREQ